MERKKTTKRTDEKEIQMRGRRQEWKGSKGSSAGEQKLVLRVEAEKGRRNEVREEKTRRAGEELCREEDAGRSRGKLRHQGLGPGEESVDRTFGEQ